jgi:hypothetical protein
MHLFIWLCFEIFFLLERKRESFISRVSQSGAASLISRTFFASQQCFSLTINQRTVFLAMAFLSNQLNNGCVSLTQVP